MTGVAPEPVQIRLLGRFAVCRGGRELPDSVFGGRKTRTLLAVLATRRGELVTHDALAEALWGDRQPADPAANLGVLVNRARGALGDPALITTGTRGYRLAGGVTVDADMFRDGVRAARQAASDGQHRRALRLLTAALELWRDEPLAGQDDAEWVREYRDALRPMLPEARETAASAALRVGEPAVAVDLAAAAVRAEPLREAAVLVLADALAASGDRAAALEALAGFRRTLADELGLDPSERLDALQARLLRGEVAGTADELDFVGRAAELAAAQAAVSADPPGVAAVIGPAGAGKSRLLTELAARLSGPLVAARAVLPERTEAWGLARSVLRAALALDPDAALAVPTPARAALVGLLPELADGWRTPEPGVGLDPRTRRSLVLEGSIRLLGAAAGGGGLLLVDDLQWADPSSLTLLGTTAERLPALGIVLAYRPEELPRSVDAFLAGLATARPLVRVSIGGLPQAAVAELLADPPVALAVLRGTDGTPFAVAEVIRGLADTGAVARDDRGRWRAQVPYAAALARELALAGQRRSIRRRAGRTSGLAHDALAALALLCRATSARTVAGVLGAELAQVLDALGRLAADGLLRLTERGWATAHDLVGETVAATIEVAERVRLHGLIAAALQVEGAEPDEIARHHRDAGDAVAASSAFAVAARRALSSAATREASELADDGLALDPPATVRAELLDARAQARARRGELAEARADIRAALAIQTSPPMRSGLLSRLALLSSGAEDLLAAAELAELALVEAGADSAARAAALEQAAILDMNLGRPERHRSRADEALTLYQRVGDAQGVARIVDGRAMATFLAGDINGGAEAFGRAARLFADSGDLIRVITPRSTRGHALVFAGRPSDGLGEVDAAVELSGALGYPEGQSYALWHRTEALAGLGDAAAALAAAEEALAIARRIAHRGWTATAWRALGIARHAAGEPDAAEAAFAESLAAAEHLSLFSSWAAARLALVRIEQRRLDAVEPLVEQALAEGPPLGHYEARLARVELAAARGDDATPAMAADSLGLALAGGYQAHVPRLRVLAGAPAPTG